MKRLFLASEVKHPECIVKLDKYLGGFAGKSIAYIPTAANGEGYGSWKSGGSWNLVQTLGAAIELVELEAYRTKAVVNKIAGKDVVWFAGGMSGYLLYWIRRCELDKALPQILNDGTLYVGSSAGSMITSRDQSLSEWYIGESEPGAGLLPGLGLVDFEIYPHFEEEQIAEIKSKYSGNRMYLLKNGEAILVEDTKVTVLGEERLIGASINT